jgi:hypothetical protein
LTEGIDQKPVIYNEGTFLPLSGIGAGAEEGKKEESEKHRK